MTIDSQKLRELRELAANATQGDWKIKSSEFGHYGVDAYNVDEYTRFPYEVVFMQVSYDGYGNGSSRRDAEFIAGVNPKVVIELLGQLEEAQNEINNLTEM